MADNPAAGTDQAQSGGTGREIVIYDPAKLARDQQAVESGFWKKVRRFASKLPFLDELLAAYYCATDPATPLQVKAILYGAPYAASPDFFLKRPNWAARDSAGYPDVFVPLMDPHSQYRDLREQLLRAIGDVIDSGRYILGPRVREAEEVFARHVGAAHGIGVANGTDALVIALRALGVGPGDEVSWRTGRQGFVASILGAAPDHASAQRIRDEFIARVRVSGTT